MLKYLEVRNFQSLKNVKIEFGQFTVLVGKTNSGKTAILRSLDLINTNNTRKYPGYISVGEKTTTISIVNDRWKVTLERSLSKGNYYLLDLETRKEERFTKLARSVPDKVRQALGPSSNSESLIFAGQFDKPYLVDEPGSHSARILGELTNVTTIFEAVREANRVKQGLSTDLRIKENDLNQVENQLVSYSDLEDLLDTAANIESEVQSLKELERQSFRLKTLVEEAKLAQSLVKEIVIPEIPDITDLEYVGETIGGLKGPIDTANTNAQLYSAATAKLDNLRIKEENLHKQVHELLVEAGECPTCGQVVIDD